MLTPSDLRAATFHNRCAGNYHYFAGPGRCWCGMATLPGTTDGTTADQRDRGPCWAGGNIAGPDYITDGYSVWSAVCPKCGGKMSVVRPGKVQCSECG